MKQVLLALIAACALSAVAFAHGDAVHVQGVVTQIDGHSVTIQPTGKGAKLMTFTAAAHTEIDRGGKVAAFTDLKVGDRVAVEIPKGKTEAESIKIGKPSAAHAEEHAHK